MPIQAQLPDGRILEFPDGTPDDVVNNAMRQTLGVSAPAQPQERGLGRTVAEEALGAALGLGQGLGRFGRGVTQAGLDVAAALGAPVEGAREFVAGEERAQRELIERNHRS